MGPPILSAHGHSRARLLARLRAEQRQQEACSRQQWELHSQYFRDQSVRSRNHSIWSSAHDKQRLEEVKRVSVEQRRTRLRAMLQEERHLLEAELSTLHSQSVKKTKGLHSAREERRKKLAQEQLKEHWKKNCQHMRRVESALHKEHVAGQGQEQISEKKQHEAVQQEEERAFQSEYERTRKDAVERMKQAQEKKKDEERKRAEALCQQMEELKLREEETSHLKKEQETLKVQHWELGRIGEERREVEERKKKVDVRHFLSRQYRAQLKRRAQQVQEELEADRNILAAMLEDRGAESVQRGRAMADAAWMKRVIEEQLELEREREAEFDTLYRVEAQRVWEKREDEWEKERTARERIMHEVLVGRQQQVEVKMQQNRQAQEESLNRREELIQWLQRERETRMQEEGHTTACTQEVNAQVEQRHQEQWEAEPRCGRSSSAGEIEQEESHRRS